MIEVERKNYHMLTQREQSRNQKSQQELTTYP
jgi:hypothetical protein